VSNCVSSLPCAGEIVGGQQRPGGALPLPVAQTEAVLEVDVVGGFGYRLPIGDDVALRLPPLRL
jgi:hypothetical protein